MAQSGTIALTVEHDGDVQAIAFSPDGTRFASGDRGSLLRVRAVENGEPLDLPSTGFVSSIAFSPDATTLAVADFEQVFFLRHARTGEVLWLAAVSPGAR